MKLFLAWILLSPLQEYQRQQTWAISDDPSTYVSTQTADSEIRYIIFVENQNFSLRAKGIDKNVGEGLHEGGLITVEENDKYLRLKNISIIIPNNFNSKFTSKEYSCKSFEILPDLFSVSCKNNLGKTIESVISKDRGILSFTGGCYLTDEELCTYVLTTPTGIRLRRKAITVTVH